MELESLFSSTRWEILELLSREELSPNEIADRLETTPANVSQQLRLLELGGLVASGKTKNIDKGKPRIIYRLSSNQSYLIMASKNFAGKKMLALSSFHKFLLSSWFIGDAAVHEAMGRLYFQLEKNMDKVLAVAVHMTARDTEAIVVTKEPGLLTGLDPGMKLAVIDAKTFQETYARKDLHPIHDPQEIIEKRKR